MFDVLVDSVARDLMGMQFGTVYMTSYGDFDNPVMGVVIRRMWWKPWRYSVKPIYWETKPMGYVSELHEGTTTSNLTLKGAIGIAKLYGVKHRDFLTEN